MPQSGAAVQVNAVVDLRLLSKLVRECHQVVDAAELCRTDVRQAADPIASTAGKARIDRCRDAILAEVVASPIQVVDHREVAEPGPVVAGADRHAWFQLVLNHRRSLPVKRTMLPP